MSRLDQVTMKPLNVALIGYKFMGKAHSSALLECPSSSRTAFSAERALAAVQRTGVKHMLGFNYRRVPAIGLAKSLIESGRLGRPRRAASLFQRG
jgi:predicted dehydrogenase